MSAHAADRTAFAGDSEMRQTLALDATMEALSENMRQARLLFDPSPATDSVVEHVVALMKSNADVGAHALELSALLRSVVESNAREGGHEQTVAGLLDAITPLLDRRRSGLTVKDAAGRLRGPLRVVDRARREVVEFRVYFEASCAIKDVLALLAPDVARGAGLRNQLGKGPHDLLLSLLPAEDAAEVSA